LFDRADAAMYKAKEAGRNWVCLAAEPGNTSWQE
jgi:PleD family two-component response regulator